MWRSSQADSAELPASVGRKEIAIAGSQVALGGNAGTAAQHQLVTHEFPVVFAERPAEGLVARIRQIRTRRPFPDIAEKLRRDRRCSGHGGFWRRMQPAA